MPPNDERDAVGKPAALWELLVERIVVDGMSVSDAAKAAGYADRTAAYAALKREKVQELLARRTREELGNLAAESLETLRTLSRSARSEKVRLDAANSILDRAGFSAGSASKTLGGISLTINLGCEPQPRSVTIEGGVGENRGTPWVSPPLLTDIGEKPEASYAQSAGEDEG